MISHAYLEKVFILWLVPLIGIITSSTGVFKYFFVSVYALSWFAFVFPRINYFLDIMSKVMRLKARRAEVCFLLFMFFILAAYGRSMSTPELKGLLPSSLAFFLSLFFLFFTVARHAAIKRKYDIIRRVLYSNHLFVLINVVGYAFGLKGENNFINSGNYGDSKILALLGLHGDRILFPFSPGLTSFAIAAGASFCIAVVGFMTMKGKEKWMNGGMVLMAAFSLAMGDARGVLLSIMFTALCYIFLSYKRNLRFAPLFVIPLSFFFLILLGLSLYLSTAGFGGGLSRGDSILSGREVIWGSAMETLSKIQFWDFFWGYGYMGQYVSGVSRQYDFLFDNWGGDSDFFTLHNFLFQTMFDVGMIGLLLLYMVMISSLKYTYVLSQSMHSVSFMTAAYILYAIISGSSESSLSVYSFLTFSPVFFLLAFMVQTDLEGGL